VVAKWYAALSGASGGASPTPTIPASPTPGHSAGNVGFVQSVAQLGNGRALAGTYATAVRSGDLLVGAFRTESGAYVSDTVNGAWKLAATCGVLSIWYLADAKPGATSVNLAASTSGQLRMDLAEYSGVAAANPLAAQSCAGGSSSTVTVPSTGQLPPGGLAFSALGTGSTPITAQPGTIGGAPATMRSQLTGTAGTIAAEDVTATLAGGQAASMYLSGAGGWSAGTAVFSHS
jgi:hypothetical protein